MIKPIPMTLEKFFKLLPKTKSFGPRITRTGTIRYETGDCPITAVRRSITGKGGKASAPRGYFQFRPDKRRAFSEGDDLLIGAADGVKSTTTTRLRRRMLHSLGLRAKKS